MSPLCEKQIADATEKMHRHLKERIAQTQSLIPTLEEARANAQKELIAVQAQRDRLGELERDLAFRVDQLNTRQKMAAQARLQSKLTFANISVLDKAVPPIEPSFPKPFIVIPVGVAAGLALGLLLALIAEATDRRIRVPVDLEFATSRPFLALSTLRRVECCPEVNEGYRAEYNSIMACGNRMGSRGQHY